MQRMIDATVHSEDVQNVTVFGENMVKHSLEYDWDEVPRFVGFDVYAHTEDGGYYLSTSDAYAFIRDLGLETAPIVDEIPVDGFDQDYEVPESEWRDGKAEGVVIINRDQEENNRSGFSTRAKLVTDEFVEKHQEEMDGGDREAVELSSKTSFSLLHIF